MKGHENNKNTLFQSQIMAMEKKMVRDSREIKCMPYVVARIYIAGSLVVWETGVRVRRNCNIFNHAMENVLKGLPDKISCTDIIHKCTSNVHIFLITFKLRDHGDEIGFLYMFDTNSQSFERQDDQEMDAHHVSFLSEADEMHTRK